MNSFEGDTFEYVDFLEVDSFNLQTTKNFVDLLNPLAFWIETFLG